MGKQNRGLFLALVKKLASLYTKVRYRNVPYKYLYFFRDTVACKLYQTKYFFGDYGIKKPYKVVDFSGEFGAELQFALPFAYWHYLNGTLKETVSTPNTKELYYFSPKHTETNQRRTNEGNYNYEIPRIIHSQDYNMKKWAQVPLKSIYRNDILVFKKPMLIIANKYNTEWDGPPVSYFSITVLDFFISQLKRKYQVIYNRPSGSHIVNDNSDIRDLNEHEWLRQQHPEVILVDDLYAKNVIKANNFNHFQLCLYANCENFISVHGGTSVLASYFGGKNLIYSRAGGEHYFNCFFDLYPKLANTEIMLAQKEEELFPLVDKFL
ncbi:MAG TPA: hypothetical protein VNQ80_02225 [Parapedobacter sp.]|uniref:hypothetical protein n=1 Tax=Parapedobacter sp. TaxID=1958893 RepID=UPI002CC803D5|nr:hypothetical protein [Parapedobacter sp.]HWK56124.1 hypothetical protein [Parapedobacter sp.]